jgi:hypothetical protein
LENFVNTGERNDFQNFIFWTPIFDYKKHCMSSSSFLAKKQLKDVWKENNQIQFKKSSSSIYA